MLEWLVHNNNIVYIYPIYIIQDVLKEVNINVKIILEDG